MVAAAVGRWLVLVVALIHLSNFPLGCLFHFSAVLVELGWVVFLLQPVYFCFLFSNCTIGGIQFVLVSIYWYPPVYMVHGSAPVLHGVLALLSPHGGLIPCILGSL